MRMSSIIIIGIVTVLTLSALACGVVGVGGVRGSGNVVTETRAVRDFTGVKLASFGNLHIEYSDEETLRIEAEDNLLQYFEIERDGETLKIKSRPGVWLRPTKSVNFYLTVVQLDTIVLSGSGNIDAPDLEAERIAVTIGGSGDIVVGDLNASEIAVKIGGSGDITTGKCDAKTQELLISGSGSVVVAGIKAGSLNLRIPGCGKVTIDEGQVETQTINLSGSGKYRPKPWKAALRTSTSVAAVRPRRRLAIHSTHGSAEVATSPT